jgi:beta-phosphoglucomutase-like phosphatase (HAD superfamily)
MLPIPPGTAALLFDCDGTLADTMKLHHAAWHEALLPYGVDCPASFIDLHAGVPTYGVVLEVNKAWCVELDGHRITAEKEACFAKRIHLSEPIEEVLATAQAYHGKLPMAVASGGSKDMVDGVLSAINAAHLFSVIITANDPVPPKPSPEIFLEAARRLNVPPEKCHVFEDGDPGIVAAERAGMTYTDVRPMLQAKAS